MKLWTYLTDNFRYNSTFETRNVKSVYYGLETISFLVGQKIWELLPSNIKDSENLNVLKSNTKFWKTVNAVCGGYILQTQDLLNYNLFYYINCVLVVVGFCQYIRIWVSLHVYMRVMGMSVWVHVYVCICALVCECGYVCVCMFVYLYICMYACFSPSVSEI